ncbi:MAG TPA: Ig-like domain-containing protein [Polyangia bacterium]|jgi:hypothetical protein
MTRSPHTPLSLLPLVVLSLALGLAAGCEGLAERPAAPAEVTLLAPDLPGVPAPVTDDHGLHDLAHPWEVVLPYPDDVLAKVLARWEAHRGERDTGTTVVYLVFDGITIYKGQDSNATTNTSWIPPSTVTIPAFNAAHWSSQGTRQQVIDKIVSWLGQVYNGYNIQFVTTRPSSGNYSMTVMGGTAAGIGQEYGVLGVSPLDCAPGEYLNLNPIDINFICTDDLGGTFNMSLMDVVYTTAHECGHTFGLAHINRPQDIMYWATSGNQSLTWGAASTRAGESNCSNNNYQSDPVYLSRAIGGSGIGQETTPPTVAITAPANGATLPSGVFDVTCTASDASGVKSVDLYYDGTKLNSLSVAPYTFGLMGILPGTHQLQAKATDWFGNVGSSSVINITVAGVPPPPDCYVDADCGAGKKCQSSHCVDGPPPALRGTIGADCAVNADCQSGVCVPGMQNYCTQACNESAGSYCPAGYSCLDGFCLADGIPPGATGAPCTQNTDCRAGLCADAGHDGYCTQICQSGGAACPNRGQCIDSGDGATFICDRTPSDQPPVPPGGSSSGCAAAPAGAEGALAALLPLALMLGFRRRRSL